MADFTFEEATAPASFTFEEANQASPSLRPAFSFSSPFGQPQIPLPSPSPTEPQGPTLEQAAKLTQQEEEDVRGLDNPKMVAAIREDYRQKREAMGLSDITMPPAQLPEVTARDLRTLGLPDWLSKPAAGTQQAIARTVSGIVGSPEGAVFFASPEAAPALLSTITPQIAAGGAAQFGSGLGTLLGGGPVESGVAETGQGLFGLSSLALPALARRRLETPTETTIEGPSYATQERPVEESRVSEHLGTEAQRVSSEAINRNRPEPSGAVATEAPKEVGKFTPVLQGESGKLYPGTSHADALNRVTMGIREGTYTRDDLVEAMAAQANDAQHKFLDAQGNVLTREEAGKASGLGGAVESQDLAKAGLIEPPKPTAPKPIAAPASEAVATEAATPAEAAKQIETGLDSLITTEGVTGRDFTKRAKSAKTQLVSSLEEAIAKAPPESELSVEQQQGLNRARESTRRSGESIAAFAARVGSETSAAPVPEIVVDIPGDGWFKTFNTKEALSEVQRRAKRISLRTEPTTPTGGKGKTPPKVIKTVQDYRDAQEFHGFGPTDRIAEWSNALADLAKRVNPENPSSVTAGDVETYIKSKARAAAQPSAEPVSVGPGAQTIGEPSRPQLAQLSDSLKTMAEQRKLKTRAAYNAGQIFSDAKDVMSSGLSGLRAAGEYALERLKNPPEFGTEKQALGDRQLAIAESGDLAKKWALTAKRATTPAEREALSNWIDTGGDAALLSQAESSVPARYKKGYRDAQNLSPELKTVAENMRNYFDSRLQEAIDAGILENGIEDYIHRTFVKDTPWKQGVLAELRSGVFTGKPALAKQRVFQYDFEAEQAGYRPVKDAAERIASYDVSLNKAIADRQYVKRLMDWKMKDGKPAIDASGVGVPVGGDPGALLVKPSVSKAVTADGRPYIAFDHPALRKWKWVDTDANGKTTMLQGNVLVHPDALPQIKAVFGKSKVRQYAAGRAALGIGSTFKQTMLDLSGFHAVQLTLHALEHRTFGPIREIDFQNPVHRGLIRGGLTIPQPRAAELFGEGLAGSSLTKYIPVVGPKLQMFNEALFGSFIPRLKMAMAQHALERNRARFPDLSEDQLYHLTANQANAAFGELNYEMLGRNKTTQDLLRLALLAPDFLEARGRFVGQGVTGIPGVGYGKEQFQALMLGAATMYIAARIGNKMLDDQYHFEPKNAFSLIYNNKAYGLRTVQGDLIHAALDTSRFVMNRLNPVYGRTLMELGTGRDYLGRKRTGLEQLKDLATGITPISFRGLLNPKEQNLVESFMNAFGITERRYIAADDIYSLAQKFKQSHNISEPGEFIYDRDKDPYRGVKLALVYQTPEAAAQEMRAALDAGTIDENKLANFVASYGSKPFTGSRSNDKKFVASLSEDQLKTYQEAVKERDRIRNTGRQAFRIYLKDYRLPRPAILP